MRTERFATPGPLTVRARTRVGGSIEVIAAETTDTEIEIQPLVPEAEAVVENARITHTTGSSGDRIEVEVDDKGVTFMGGDGGARGIIRRVISLATDGPAVRILIHCPLGTNLDLQAASGEIQIDGRVGDVETQTASGGVRIGDVEGNLRSRTASGDVTIQSVGGSAQVETASGDVTARRLEGPAIVRTASGEVNLGQALFGLTVRTASGDVRVEECNDCESRSASGDQRFDRLGGGVVRIESASGDVLMAIARGTLVRVDSQSVSGSMRSDIDFDTDPDEEPTGEQDSGPQLDLRVRTVSGDVSVRRAP